MNNNNRNESAPGNSSDPERAIDSHEAARLLGVATITLAQWRGAAQGPRWFKCGGRSVRYRLGDVLSYRDGRMKGGSK